MMTTKSSDYTEICVIDDLYVPCTVFGDDSPNGEPGLINYWGYGYETIEAATRAVQVTEARHNTPAGIPVSMDSGKRRA